MSDEAAQMYKILGAEPPPGHEIVATMTVARTQVKSGAGGHMFGVVGAVVEHQLSKDLPAKNHSTKDAKAIWNAQNALGITQLMVWGVNRHNVLIFESTKIGAKRPKKLSARVPLREVSIEGRSGRKLALRLHGVPVEVSGSKDAVERFADALRTVLPV